MSVDNPALPKPLRLATSDVKAHDEERRRLIERSPVPNTSRRARGEGTPTRQHHELNSQHLRLSRVAPEKATTQTNWDSPHATSSAGLGRKSHPLFPGTPPLLDIDDLVEVLNYEHPGSEYPPLVDSRIQRQPLEHYEEAWFSPGHLENFDLSASDDDEVDSDPAWHTFSSLNGVLGHLRKQVPRHSAPLRKPRWPSMRHGPEPVSPRVHSESAELSNFWISAFNILAPGPQSRAPSRLLRPACR